jgi:uncharacterized repeat protein (TIGR02543 family)
MRKQDFHVIIIIVALCLSVSTAGLCFDIGSVYATEGSEPDSADVTASEATGSESGRNYTITFDQNGGKGLKSKKLVIDDETTDFKLPSPKKDRSKFKGWYLPGSIKVTTKFLKGNNENIKLTAKWQKVTKILYTFDRNWGSASAKPIATEKYKYDKKVIKLPVAKRGGFDFLGWYTKPRGGDRIYIGSKTTSKLIAKTLYAHWAPKQYFQFDPRWARKPYVTTIIGSGCGPTATAMVVNAIKNNGVTPVTATSWSASHGYKTTEPGKTKSAFFSKYPAQFGIKSKRVYSGDLRYLSAANAKPYHKKALKAVKAGNWVICFMGPGAWTHFGHYVLWYDVEGSRALVRDPNATKATKTRNTIKTLNSQVISYWIVKVPDEKKLYRP